MGLISAFSGGKDSTAMVLRMAEDGEDFSTLFTPTGDESAECIAHLHRVVELTGKPFEIQPSGQTLFSLIEQFGALPNNRQRWCTRMLKIEPAKAYLLAHPGSTLCVGLRADEELRDGMWGEQATYRYPLREYGWGIEDVRALRRRPGIRSARRRVIPGRHH